MEVTPFTQQEAIEFLKGQLPEQEERQLQLLIDQLHSYPLALGIAAAYMVEDEMSLQDFLQELNQEDFIQQEGSERYPFSMKKVWRLAFRKLNTHHPFALKWLQVCSYLSPEGIPLDWMRAWLQEKSELSVGQVLEATRTLLKVLKSYTLVRYDSRSKHLSVHRLLQEALRFLPKLQKKVTQQKEEGIQESFAQQTYKFLLERKQYH
ncbi:hypothetical protein [Neochlamydia sp. S13]|uniref:DUF7779 domain-containing protein n=1 Tax=Neochlamydia sp. S13 TaxID=1353976 RepID=UPI0005A78867|nr:hypothetical protein [Neochlamydia sp. S13]BBI17832.1 NB-ARC domain protein [Neochlamydia sp. S13]